MRKSTGFMEFDRQSDSEIDPIERLKNWKEFKIHGDDKTRQAQGARCSGLTRSCRKVLMRRLAWLRACVKG